MKNLYPRESDCPVCAERLDDPEFQLEGYRANARALRAVRVLDAYDPLWSHGRVSGFPAVVVTDKRRATKGKTRWFRQKSGHLSFEAARIAAADALLAEDPTLGVGL